MSAPLKEKLRRELREQNQRPEAERALASEQIARRLKEQPLWSELHRILFFAALPGEPDLRSLCEEALAAGKTVAFLRYVERSNSYAAARIIEPRKDLTPGRFGVPEPSSSCPEISLNALDFVLVPGLGFSLNGARLGRGKGYYDRLLTSVSGLRCGVAFDWQVVAEIPTEPHDVLLDCLVTPSHWRDFRKLADK